MLNSDLFLRYQRQVALEEVGESGQRWGWSFGSRG